MPPHYQVAFDLLRIVSFAAILLGHVTLMLGSRFPADGLASHLLKSVYPFTLLGTMTFFALAGFYLCRTLLQGEAAGPAILRRLQRVYPPYAIMTLAYATVLLMVPWGDKMPVGAAARVGYVVSNLLMLPSISTLPTILAVGWAVGSVVYAYIVIAFAYDHLKLREWPRPFRVGLWLFVGAALQWLGANGAAQQLHLDLFRLSGFAVGALAAELWAPLGAWRITPDHPRSLIRFVGGVRFALHRLGGKWVRRLLETPMLQKVSRFGASWAYHTLLTQGISLHLVRLLYPFGKAPGVADLIAVVTLGLVLSHAAAWVLADCERTIRRTATALWRGLRMRPGLDPAGSMQVD